MIESLQNQRIKQLIKLQQKSRERKKEDLFVVEGIQENELALKGGFIPFEFYICNEIFNHQIDCLNHKTHELALPVFEKLAYRKSTGGIIGVYKTKKTILSNIDLDENPLIVVLESVEKPGNLGAVLRSCDGAKVTAVVICDPLVDFYNPNVIRSSVGTIFTNQLASCKKEELYEWLNQNQIKIKSTFLQKNTVTIYESNLNEKTAIVLGTESTGLSDFWLSHSNELIKIPMLGKVDSLNVSNATAICVYEAVRQRNYEKS